MHVFAAQGVICLEKKISEIRKRTFDQFTEGEPANKERKTDKLKGHNVSGKETGLLIDSSQISYPETGKDDRPKADRVQTGFYIKKLSGSYQT